MTWTPDRTLNKANLDAQLTALDGKRKEWAQMDTSKKLKYLDFILKKNNEVAPAWVKAAVAAKKIPADSPVAGEEWLNGPACVARIVRLVRDSVRQLADGHKPYIRPDKVHDKVNGKGIVVQVFPNNGIEKMMFQGFTAEVWQQEGVTRENLADTQATFYDSAVGQREGAVSLVLGAGNVSSITLLDVVHKLFVEGKVCMLKFNPVNDYLGEFFGPCLQSLIDDGFVTLSYGGGDVGAYLCQHDLVHDIHITGSVHTHNIIVWGPGAEGEKRRQSGAEPLLKKEITSELGNVSPIIVVPGKWSKSDIAFQAENVVAQLVNNGGFNCNAAKVLVLPEDWAQKSQFLEAVYNTFTKIHQRNAYYPGAEDRYKKFLDAHSGNAHPCGEKKDHVVPWTVFPDLDPKNKDELCFREEAFCGIVGQTALPSASIPEYLAAAVEFCNETLYGTLSASILIHPSTEKEHKAAFENALADLRYGSIGVNHWAALSYALGQTGWGAYPGHTIRDVQSGIGTVHNSLFFDKLEKSIVRGPFRMFPKPSWFPTNKQMHKIGEALTNMETNPSYFKLFPLIFHAIRG